MAREPQRREQPRHLDAAIVPVERALTARAKAIDARAKVLGNIGETAAANAADTLTAVAQEFRALANELHHW